MTAGAQASPAGDPLDEPLEGPPGGPPGGPLPRVSPRSARRPSPTRYDSGNFVIDARNEARQYGPDGLARSLAFCAGLWADLDPVLSCPFDADREAPLAAAWLNGRRVAHREAGVRAETTLWPAAAGGRAAEGRRR